MQRAGEQQIREHAVEKHAEKSRRSDTALTDRLRASIHCKCPAATTSSGDDERDERQADGRGQAQQAIVRITRECGDDQQDSNQVKSHESRRR